jgi:hypothetical protein
MREYYRPAIQNGRIPRRVFRSASPASRIRSGRSRQAHREESERIISADFAVPAAIRNQSTIALLMLTGGSLVIAASFLFGLHQHFDAARINQEDARLRMDIQKAEAQQGWLSVERARIRSPRQLEEKISGTGLMPLSLEQKETQRR